MDVIEEVDVAMDIQTTVRSLIGRHEDLLFCAWVGLIAREGVADDGVVTGEDGAYVRNRSPSQLALRVHAEWLPLLRLTRERVERRHRGVIRGSIVIPDIKVIKKVY